MSKKAVEFRIEDGCGNYIITAQFGKYRYVVAENRNRSKASYTRLAKLVVQANEAFDRQELKK